MKAVCAEAGLALRERRMRVTKMDLTTAREVLYRKDEGTPEGCSAFLHFVPCVWFYLFFI